MILFLSTLSFGKGSGINKVVDEMNQMRSDSSPYKAGLSEIFDWVVFLL